jgi:hypothetical protein
MSVHRFSVLTTVYAGSDPDLLVLSLASAKIAISNATPHQGTHRVYVDGPVSEEIMDVVTELGPQEILYGMDERRGPAYGLNRLLDRCGDDTFVFIQDGDDISLPSRFADSLQAFNSTPELDILGAQAVECHTETQRIKALRYPQSSTAILKTLPRKAPFAHSTVGYRMIRLRERFRYNESMMNTIDLELHARLLLDGYVAMNQSGIQTLLLFDQDFFRRRSTDKWPNEWRIYRHIQKKAGQWTDLLLLLLRGAVRWAPKWMQRVIYTLR